MANPDILAKLRWVIFVVLGLCLMVTPALAEVTSEYHNRRVPLSAGESLVELPAESLDYYSTDLFFNAGEFDFASKGEELATKKAVLQLIGKKRRGQISAEKLNWTANILKVFFPIRVML